MTARACRARREARGDSPCTDPPDFDIVVTQPGGREMSRTPACWTHGLAEVERAHRAGGIATAELVEHRPARWPRGDEQGGAAADA